MRHSLLVGLVVLGTQLHAQNNMVPNSAFELHYSCPGNDCNIMTTCIPDWSSPNIGSPDYYHFCTTHEWVRPDHNVFGGQQPLSGDAFVGIYCFTKNQPEGREYIQVQLTHPLQQGIRYQVGFHVSLADLSLYAISSLGAHLSIQPPSSNEYWVLDVEPQIQNPAGNIIADTSGWVLVTDTFVSRTGGGEQWLTIGNFNYAAQSDTLAFQPPNPDMGNFFFSYYYIDDVSVVALDSVPSGMEEQEDLCFVVYPNPAREVLRFKIQGSTWQHGSLGIRVMDAVGREVQTPLCIPHGEVNGNIDVSGLPKGIYLLELTDAEGKRAVRRFVKE